ncbi:MAG: gamma-glutamyl-gamma-aminobutyrate hydrolase family protein [Thermodesulfovibrionales bacterium]|nr:gamma-glutamyl-gamma-aminobutyrate hydrolase family protein [Thermodesulfovibrionales bacterium]
MKPLIGITSDMDEHVFKLRQDYVRAVEMANGLPLVAAPQRDVAKISELIDGLIISGGDDLPPEYYGETVAVPPERLRFVRNERVDFELALLKEMVKRYKPILAVCYGMQLVNVAFGGSLYQDIEYQIEGAINHKEGGHLIKIDEDFYYEMNNAYSELCSPQSVNSSHRQAVKGLGEGLSVFATSKDGIIEGFYKKGYPFLVGVQWHPERSLTTRDKETGLEKYDKLSLAIFERFIKTAGEIKEQHGN